MTNPNPYVVWRGNQAWGSWSAGILINDNRALYYTGTTPATGCPNAAAAGTTLCAFPGDKLGWAWLSGIEFKLPMIAQGDRIGFFFNYGQGASAYSGGTNVGSPALFGSGNQVALGVKTDAVYVNGGGMELTTSWTLAGAYEHYWLPNLSTTLYGGRTSIEYNNNVVNSRIFCGANGGAAQRITIAANVACDPGFKLWQFGAHTDWYPVPGFRLGAEIGYVLIESAFNGQVVNLTQATGARPAGLYQAKNQGIAAFAFRAQRGFGGVGE